MEKYKIILKSEKYPETGDERELELSPEQVRWVEEGLKLGMDVPLYATTFAKSKYGDCKIGSIIKITKIN